MVMRLSVYDDENIKYEVIFALNNNKDEILIVDSIPPQISQEQESITKKVYLDTTNLN